MSERGPVEGNLVKEGTAVEKQNPIVVVEEKTDRLFEKIRAVATSLVLEKVDYAHAEELLEKLQPRAVIFKLNHQKEKVHSLLRSFSEKLVETRWVASAESIDTETLLQLVRIGLDDFLKQPVTVKEFQALLDRLSHAKSPGEAPVETHRLVSFFSTKGGVGTSFVAVNFAVTWAKKRPGRVLAADFVLQHGNLAEFLDLTPQFTLLDLEENLERIDPKLLENSIQKHGSGLLVLPCPRSPEESECFTAKETEQILHVLKDTYPVVVADLGHEFNTASLACLDASEFVFLVVTPDLPSLYNTKLALDTLKKLGYSEEKVKLVLNRWHQKGEVDSTLIEKNLGRRLFYKLPDDPALVLSSVNQGVPISELSQNSELAQNFEELVERVRHGPS